MEMVPDWIREIDRTPAEERRTGGGLPEGVKRSDEEDERDIKDRVAVLETENAQLKEALELLLSGVTEVTDNG